MTDLLQRSLELGDFNGLGLGRIIPDLGPHP
jgi:hypothetical protein